MTANDALEALYFGSVDSESEDDLDRLFVKTRDFDKFLKRNTFLALGAKGTGKSALYELFTRYEDAVRKLAGRALDGVIIASGTGLGDLSEVATGDLQELQLPDGTYDHNRIWRLYIAVKSALALNSKIKIPSGPLKELLTEAGARKDNRIGPLLLDLWVKAVAKGPSEIKIAARGSSVSFGDSKKKQLDVVSILSSIQTALQQSGSTIWLLFDKVDEIWPGDPDERRRALEGLISEVMQIRRLYPAIQPKILLRTDLWAELHFTNKDHLTDKRIELGWNRDQLESLLVRRAVHPAEVWEFVINQHPELRRRTLADDWSRSEIRAALQAIFPPTAYPGDKEADFMSWLYERVKDGRGTALPRDAIVLAREAAEGQLDAGPASDKTLISREAVREAFTRTSQIRCETFLAEFPDLKTHFGRFKGQTTSVFSRAELLELMSDLDPTGDKMLERLCEIGVLRPDSERALTAEKFEVPRLYRTGLGLVIRGRP